MKVYNADGSLRFSFYAYEAGFLGGVRVATGDVTGDGVPDIITGAGAGAGPHVKVFDGATGAEIRSFFAYDANYTGGVFVAAGDLNGDGLADIVTSAAAGTGHVRAFDTMTGAAFVSFLPYGAEFLGGVNVAVGDVDGDGTADIVTGTNAGPSNVRAFTPSGEAFRSFLAYSTEFLGGVSVATAAGAAGVVNVATAPGIGGDATASLFDLRAAQPANPVRSFSAFSGFGGGTALTANDIDGDGIDDFIVGVRGGTAPHVKVFRGTDDALLDSFFAFDTGFLGGVNVG